MSHTSLDGYPNHFPDGPLAKRLARIRALLESAQQAYEADQNDASLILLYSALDVIGLVARTGTEPSNSGQNFQRWLDKYVLCETNVGASSEDLWSARCGIVHALSHESRKTQRGNARVIIYVRGDQQAGSGRSWAAILAEAISHVPTVSRVPPDQLAVVHLGTLLAAVRSGFEQYANVVLSNDELDRLLTERMAPALTTITVRAS